MNLEPMNKPRPMGDTAMTSWFRKRMLISEHAVAYRLKRAFGDGFDEYPLGVRERLATELGELVQQKGAELLASECGEQIRAQVAIATAAKERDLARARQDLAEWRRKFEDSFAAREKKLAAREMDNPAIRWAQAQIDRLMALPRVTNQVVRSVGFIAASALGAKSDGASRAEPDDGAGEPDEPDEPDDGADADDDWSEPA